MDSGAYVFSVTIILSVDAERPVAGRSGRGTLEVAADFMITYRADSWVSGCHIGEGEDAFYV